LQALFSGRPGKQRAVEEVQARLERQRLEERFIEAQKMEVIGQLAGRTISTIFWQ
jgi:hypothetical protein